MSPTHPLLEEHPAMRPLVRESWQRSLEALSTPDGLTPPLVWESRELIEFRRQHPLAAIMPVINKLLIEPSHDTGLLIAVGDEHGRLLWVEGDSAARRHGENINFATGADWSESVAGTSAPGTALVLGKSVQIVGQEHFNPAVHSWSCTAVPMHDPDSGLDPGHRRHHRRCGCRGRQYALPRAGHRRGRRGATAHPPPGAPHG
ncbi:hypothetical protein [Arthrobacter psychrolactophilus]